MLVSIRGGRAVTVRVDCPSCQMACRVPAELEGRFVRCPGCQKPFIAAPPPPAPTPSPPAMPALRVTTATSVGKARERNEDASLVMHFKWHACGEGRETALVMVADGMGGHQAGDRAAALALGAVAGAMSSRLAGLVTGEEWDDEASVEGVDLALWEASRAVLRAAEEGACEGMGATAVAAWIYRDRVALCHVGDCRAYFLHQGELTRLTEDQTLARRMVEMGTLRAEEAEGHPAASQVSQALGRQPDLEPSRPVRELEAGDVLLLCCDGLHGQVSDEAIREALAEEDAAERLVRLADEAGGADNCTAVVVRV
jgi:protein phosphatase